MQRKILQSPSHMCSLLSSASRAIKKLLRTLLDVNWLSTNFRGDLPLFRLKQLKIEVTQKHMW